MVKINWNKAKTIPVILIFWVFPSLLLAQPARAVEIAFVSDTQAPMWIERTRLQYNENEKATALIFANILKVKPRSLFILGDVVSKGAKTNKWLDMDRYLSQCRDAGIEVTALLGNHDVMGNEKKGEFNFQQRFPNHVNTGYYQIIDSVAIVLLNSNFNNLTDSLVEKQRLWLTTTLQSMDYDPSILAIIVTCHHPPHTNSKIVHSSREVQQYFEPQFLQSKKTSLFITGHSHNFEHFARDGKDFLVIGGGGGLKQPLISINNRIEDVARSYKPLFHYLRITRKEGALTVNSYFLTTDFSDIQLGYSFVVPLYQEAGN